MEAEDERGGVGDDLRGSLGQFDSGNDSSNDLVDREGTVVTNVDTFLEGWRTQPGESMFVQ